MYLYKANTGLQVCSWGLGFRALRRCASLMVAKGAIKGMCITCSVLQIFGFQHFVHSGFRLGFRDSGFQRLLEV